MTNTFDATLPSLTLAAAPLPAGVAGAKSAAPAAATTATTGADGAPPLGAPQSPAPSPFGNIMFLMLGLLGLMIFMQIWAARKDKKKRQDLISNLRRHDKVLTVGGIVGTVSEVRDDEVVLKVDESTNTKIRFSKSAIQQVVRQSSSDEPAPAAKSAD